MYDEFILFDRNGAQQGRWRRLPLGETAGRNEAWLRDLIAANPQLLPIREIDAGFGPLVPLCTELRTEAGPIDAAFINRDGKLTIVECKLWRNPEARRTVVAQTLDYARTLTRWSYSDLQRQVCARLRERGNVPFERVRALHPDLSEQAFVDATARHLKAGRLLMVIVGDGIREDVEAIAELINRNGAGAFQLAVVEAALYDAADHGVVVQARILAKTRLLERVVYASAEESSETTTREEEDDAPSAATGVPSADVRAWWAPVLAMTFDDPDQPPPVYVNNYVRAALPWPGLSVSAYRHVRGDSMTVYLGGQVKARRSFFEAMGPDALQELNKEIPEAEVVQAPELDRYWFHVTRRGQDFPTPDAQRDWIIQMINRFATALRPRMNRMLEASRL